MRRSPFGNRLGRKTRLLGMALVMVVGIALMGGVVMLLWNWLMPGLFTGASQIDYWRALGLLLLSKLLLGGGRGRWHARRQHWEGMTADERAHFREHLKSRWGSRFGADKAGCAAHGSSSPASGHDAASDARPTDPIA